MRPQTQITGICSTCNHAPECAHYRKSKNAGEPIWFCENFDDRSPIQPLIAKGLSLEDRISQSENLRAVSIPGRMKGLCLNCANRVSCRLPTREGGVWHCEEYC